MHIPQGRISAIFAIISGVMVFTAWQHDNVILFLAAIPLMFFGFWLDIYVSRKVLSKINRKDKK